MRLRPGLPKPFQNPIVEIGVMWKTNTSKKRVEREKWRKREKKLNPSRTKKFCLDTW